MMYCVYIVVVVVVVIVVFVNDCGFGRTWPDSCKLET